MLYSLHEYVILLDHENDKIIDKPIRNMKSPVYKLVETSERCVVKVRCGFDRRN
jgi:hypothetical protein